MIALEPFIVKFVFAIIQNIQSQNFSYEEKQVIHADLVPRISEKIMQSSLRGKEVLSARKNINELVVPMSRSISETSVKIPVRPRPVLSLPILPLQKPVSSPPIPPRQIPALPPRTQSENRKVIAPRVPMGIEFSQDYGRITPLLNDPVISLIECQGAGKPLMIIRAGQRQITRITLNPVEIKEILQKASDGAHTPLLEGVFRAVVDNFSINAIISEMVGSRFVIRKQTPYSLLEDRFK